MSVFTPVTAKELSDWLSRYAVGSLIDFEGIEAGIDNSNFFVTTENARFVLTLFERLTESDIDYYLHVMAHLGKTLPCAKPVSDKKGRLYSVLNNKPAALIVRLPGKNIMQPGNAACEQVGQMLAKMHIAGQHYPDKRPHPRNLSWCIHTADIVKPYLTSDQTDLLDREIQFQKAQPYDALSSSIIHADLFRDNVLFDRGRLTGIIDFYFSGWGNCLFDLAVTVNDWCMASASEVNEGNRATLLAAYCSQRPVTDTEKACWPAMLRLAALRFWLSRVYDKFLPRDGSMVLCHDPLHFENMLRYHIAQFSSENTFSYASLPV